MNSIGIDLGSRFVKTAINQNDKTILKRYNTVDFYKNYIKRNGESVEIDVETLGFPKDLPITATGYGRNLMSFSNAEIISEIKAHFRGALRKSGQKDFILIDIGGQDSKVIYGKDGYIEDFLMNDKCAASTGRFAENACTVLGITLEELSLMTTEPAKLSSTCAVFCESEIIGLLASGTKISSIASGVNQSIAKRLAPLVKSFKADVVFASGGVATNKALLYFLSKILGIEITALPDPQFNGAQGCLYE